MNNTSKSNTSVSDMSSRLVRIARWRYAFGWIISLVVVVISALFFALLAYFLLLLIWSCVDHLWGKLTKAPAPETLFAFHFGPDFFLGLLAVSYVSIYALPFILTLPVTSVIVGLWQAPPRFLFLRPFNRGLLSRPLKRVARRDIAPFGHIYTLSDADINVPWYIRIPILLGQLALFSFRMRTIRDTKQIKAIERKVDRIWLRNINWCLSFKKIFPVRSSDARWREVVDCLLKRSSALIVDVSDLRENVTWEIDRARSVGAEPRILYLISSERAEGSHAALVQALGQGACASRLFRYGRGGLTDRERFRAVLAETVVAHAIAEYGWQRTHAPTRLSIAATVAFVLGLIPVFVNVGLNFAIAWTPTLEFPVFLTKPDHTEVLPVGAFWLTTWFLLILAAKRTQTIRFLLVLQTLLMLVTVMWIGIFLIWIGGS